MASAGLAAAENTVGTALTIPLLARQGAYVGDDTGFAEASLDILMGTALGGAFGAGGAWWHSRAGRGWQPPGSERPPGGPIPPPVTPEGVAPAAANTTLAVDDIVAGRPVDVAAKVAREAEAVGRVYDYALANPLDRPDAAVARLEPEDLEAVLLEKGPAILGADGEIVVQGRNLQQQLDVPSGGSGAVKILWKHGERSGKAGTAGMVLREDVLAVPRVVREWQPASIGRHGVTGEIMSYAWQVERSSDGAQLRYVVSRDAPGDPMRVVSIHVRERNQGQLSKPRAAGTPPSPIGVHTRDTAAGIPERPAGGEAPASGKIRPASGSGNIPGESPAVPEGATREENLVWEDVASPRPSDPSTGRPERDHDAEIRAQLELPDEELDLAGGGFPELLEYETAVRAGKVDGASRAEVDAADRERPRWAGAEAAWKRPPPACCGGSDGGPSQRPDQLQRLRRRGAQGGGRPDHPVRGHGHPRRAGRRGCWPRNAGGAEWVQAVPE